MTDKPLVGFRIHNDMSISAAEAIKERERINLVLREFYLLPTWTPAMGAMLISGVLPIVGSITVPDADSGAPSLRNPAVPADWQSIKDAHRVLDHWIDSYLDREEGSEAAAAISVAVLPGDFLYWCDEEYENSPDWRKPKWIVHWEALIGYGRNFDSLLPPAPSELVSHAAELVSFASVVQVKLLQPEPTPKPEVHLDDQDAYVKQMRLVILDSRSTISTLIVKAMASSGNPRSTQAVWAALRAMAENNTHGILKYVDNETVKIPTKSGWQDYKYESFEQAFLRWKNSAAPKP